MRAGRFRAALVALTLAGELNQGDAACRLHLAQTRVALGHDKEAAEVLRRALQLQPKLVAMPLNLDRYYPEPENFASDIDALATRLAQRQATADEYFLLGFMQFQRGNFDAAYAAFEHTAAEMPKDELTQSYLQLTKPASR